MQNLIDKKKELSKTINESEEWATRCTALKTLHESNEWKEYQVAQQALKDLPEYQERTEVIREMKELKALDLQPSGFLSSDN
jgi:cell fate (sporulation/competence/biofilm development) regulator YlbF (YheA/YmcA/DUF963 family)